MRAHSCTLHVRWPRRLARHRGDLPALVALERFGQDGGRINFTSEVELTDVDGTRCELDFAVLDDSDLYLGEAFTAAKYAERKKDELERLGRLASVVSQFNARGVILATAAPAMHQPTVDRAKSIFSSPWPLLEIRTAAFALPRPVRSVDTS
jgi:hypothetical protein